MKQKLYKKRNALLKKRDKYLRSIDQYVLNIKKAKGSESFAGLKIKENAMKVLAVRRELAELNRQILRVE